LPRAFGQKATRPSSSIDCSIARCVARTSVDTRFVSPAAAKSGANGFKATEADASAMRCSVQP
jgi:hypothetical protein